jgi:uncharacterized protein
MRESVATTTKCLLIVWMLIFVLPGSSFSRPQGAASKSDVLQAFDFGKVELLPGLMYDKFAYTKNYYMSIPNDNMLYEFRLSVGVSNPPGHRLGGWYESLAGLTLPQWISAYCRMYAITGDTAARSKATYLVDEWWKCVVIGFSSGSVTWNAATNALNAGNGGKWVIALLDFYKYCGRQDALDKIRQLIAWSYSGWWPHLFGDNDNEWYTLSWPLYEFYMTTGDIKYKNMGTLFEYREYWDEFVTQPVTPFARAPVAGQNAEFCHAYSHLNSFNAAGEAYRAKGDAYYLTAMKNAYDWMQNEQMFATGGYGPELEHLMPMDRITASLSSRTDHFETQCGTWAAIRLSQNLVELTGDGRYGNWIERLAYNAINASIPMTMTGNGLYYSNYNTYGALKLNRPVEWTCCDGTRPLDVLQYHVNTYFYDSTNIYVNLFTPSSVNWERNNNIVRLTQITDFPYSETTELTILTGVPDHFGIGLRIPEWLAGVMTAQVNGQSVGGTILNGWFIISRSWNSGDKLTVTLPMDFWLSVLDRKQGGPTAVMYGPLAMAFTTPDRTLITVAGPWWSYTGMMRGNPNGELLGSIDLKNIHGLLTSVDQKLGFEVTSHSYVKLKPFMSYGEAELYYLYIEGGVSSVRGDPGQTPVEFSLSQNYPNPFNPATEIKYSIGRSSYVTLKVYNMLGQVVADLVRQQQEPGNYNVQFDASKFPSGIYLCRIEAGSYFSSMKMVLLK